MFVFQRFFIYKIIIAHEQTRSPDCKIEMRKKKLELSMSDRIPISTTRLAAATLLLLLSPASTWSRRDATTARLRGRSNIIVPRNSLALATFSSLDDAHIKLTSAACFYVRHRAVTQGWNCDLVDDYPTPLAASTDGVCQNFVILTLREIVVIP